MTGREQQQQTEARQAVYAEFGVDYSAGVAAVEDMADALVDARARLSGLQEARDQWGTPEARKAWADLHETVKQQRRELSGLQDTLAEHGPTFRYAIENLAAIRAYRAELGASEWEAMLTPEERAALAALALNADGPGSVPGDAPTEKENA